MAVWALNGPLWTFSSSKSNSARPHDPQKCLRFFRCGRRAPTPAASKAAELCVKRIRGALWVLGSTSARHAFTLTITPAVLAKAHDFFSAEPCAGRRPVRASRPLADRHGRPRQRVEVVMAPRVSAARGRHRTAHDAGWQPASASSACTGLSRPLRACSAALNG